MLKIISCKLKQALQGKDIAEQTTSAIEWQRASLLFSLLTFEHLCSVQTEYLFEILSNLAVCIFSNVNIKYTIVKF